MTIKYKLKQAKWILDNEDGLRPTSCPPFEHVNSKYLAGCMYCIVNEHTPKNGTCPIKCKIHAANIVINKIRKYKLNRITNG